jgi:hypothetical protein
MTNHRLRSRRVSVAVAVGLIAVGVAAPAARAAALPGPRAEEVIQRMIQTIDAAPHVLSADAEFRLRVKKPLSEPPDCVFRGTVTVVSRHPTIKIDEQTTGLICWLVNRYVIGRQFHPREDLESFLSRFAFDVLGEKFVGNDRYYLVAGKAKDPKTQPTGLVGWIDFDRGLLVEGTVRYPWGDIDNEQGYARMQNIWMLTYQYLYTPRFSTSMEVLYSNFHFQPQ